MPDLALHSMIRQRARPLDVRKAFGFVSAVQHCSPV